MLHMWKNWKDSSVHTEITRIIIRSTLKECASWCYNEYTMSRNWLYYVYITLES